MKTTLAILLTFVTLTFGADKDIIWLQENSGATLDEVTVSPIAGSVLTFSSPGKAPTPIAYASVLALIGGQATGNYITSITGDATASGPGAATLTLATVATAGTTGSASAIPVITIDAKGRTTSITTAAVVAPAGTLTGGTLASNVLSSSLTSVGTLTAGATGAGFTIALSVSTVTGTLPDAQFPGTLPTSSGVNLTALTAANITASTTVGRNVLNLTNPSAIRFLRVNVDNSADLLSASDFRTAIGAGVGGGDALTSGHLGQFASTTSAQLKTVLSDELGTGKVIFSDGTLAVASAKTLTVSNTITFTATDGSTLAIGTGGTLGTAAFTATSSYTSSTVVPNTAPSAGQILVGDGTNYVKKTVTGIFTLDSTGLATAQNDSIALGALVDASTGSRLVGKASGASGSWGEVSLGTGLAMSVGGVLSVSGVGTGDVIGPATNTADFIPLWNGANSKTLKDGLATSTGGSSGDVGKVLVFGTSGSIRAFAGIGVEGGSTDTLLTATLLNFVQSGGTGSVQSASLTSSRGWIFPDQSGTVAITTDLPIKAWVNFDGTTATTTANVSGTYARTSPSTTLTITVTAHGHIAGHVIYADFTTGTGVDGVYTVVSVVDANNFTITTAASTTTSGAVTLLRKPIRASLNVNSVTYQNAAGKFYVNFTTAWADGNYVVSGSGSAIGVGYNWVAPGFGAAPTANACEIQYLNSAGTVVQSPLATVQFVR